MENSLVWWNVDMNSWILSRLKFPVHLNEKKEEMRETFDYYYNVKFLNMSNTLFIWDELPTPHQYHIRLQQSKKVVC